MDAVVSEFESTVAKARLGGGAKAAERMRGRGKKLPRERCVDAFFECDSERGRLRVGLC